MVFTDAEEGNTHAYPNGMHLARPHILSCDSSIVFNRARLLHARLSHFRGKFGPFFRAEEDVMQRVAGLSQSVTNRYASDDAAGFVRSFASSLPQAARLPPEFRLTRYIP